MTIRMQIILKIHLNSKAPTKAIKTYVDSIIHILVWH